MTTQRISDAYGEEDDERLLPRRNVTALESPYQSAKVRARRALMAAGERRGVQPEPTLPPPPTQDASLFTDRPQAALPDPGSRTERTLLDLYASRTPESMAIGAATERGKALQYRAQIAELERANRGRGNTAKQYYASLPRIEELERLADRADRDAKMYEEGKLPRPITATWQEKYFEPAAGSLVYAIQKGIPIWEGEVEKRAAELRKQGYSYTEASRLAYTASDLPWGVKGLAETAVDPTNLLPGIGYGGEIARVARYAAKGAANATRAGSAKAGASILKSIQTAAEDAGQRGSIKFPGGADDVPLPGQSPGMPEAGVQADLFGGGKVVKPKGKGVPTQIGMDDALKLQQRIEEEKVMLETIKETKNPAPRFGTPERDAYDEARRAANERGQPRLSKAKQIEKQQAKIRGLEAELKASQEATPPPGVATPPLAIAEAKVDLSTVRGTSDALRRLEGEIKDAAISNADVTDLRDVYTELLSYRGSLLRQVLGDEGVDRYAALQKALADELAKPSPSQTTLRHLRAAMKHIERLADEAPLVREPPPVAAAAPPPRPPSPPTAEGLPSLPSGRKPGGPQNIKAAPAIDALTSLEGAVATPPSLLETLAKEAAPDSVLRRVYDNLYPFRKLEELSGVPVHQIARLTTGYRGASEIIETKVYAPVFRALGKDVRNLQTYMNARRVADIEALSPNVTKYPGGLTGLDQSLQALDSLKQRVGAARYASIEEAAEKLWKANDEHILQEMRKGGLLSEESLIALRQKHPHYIPWFRHDFMDEVLESFNTPTASISNNTVKAMTESGSERLLDAPLRNMVGKVHQVQAAVFRNRASRTLVASLLEMGEKTGETLVRPIVGAMKEDAEWGAVSFFVDGVQQRVLVPRLYADVAKDIGVQETGGLLRAVQVASAPLRYGATQYNPGFLIVNAMRDQAMAMFNYNQIPFGPDWIRGMRSAILKDATFDEAARAGTFYGGLSDAERAIGKGLPKLPVGGIEVRNPMDALLLPFTLTRRANVNLERGTRLGAYSRAKMNGLDALEAAITGRNVSVDFSQMGTWVRPFNAAIPFMNAAIQGGAKIAETSINHPLRSTAYAALFAMPTILSRVNNMRYETSNLINDREYDRHWVWQVGEGKRSDGSKFPLYVKIPKGEAAGLFSFPFEALFHAARKGEDRSAVELLLRGGAASLQNLSPVDVLNPVPSNPLIQTGVGWRTGVDPFSGIPIVPQRERGLLPGQQFGPETTNTAIALGRKFGVSPRLIDFSIGNLTGGAGQISNWMVSTGMGALGYNAEQFGAATAGEAQARGIEAHTKKPFVRSFVGTRSTQLESRGYEKFNAAVRKSNEDFNKIPGMNTLGMRLGEAGDLIDLIPGAKGTDAEITTAQRARHQELLAELAIPAVRKLKLSGDATKQKEQVQKALTKARAAARDKLIDEIDWPKDEATQMLVADRKVLKPYLDVGATIPLPKPAVARRRLAMRDANPALDAALIKYGLVDEPRTLAGRKALLDRKLKEQGK